LEQKKASLAIMVGGEQDVFNEALDVLKAMGNPTLVGPSWKWTSF
jgi:2-hydroxy-3-oxopropionate reductase